MSQDPFIPSNSSTSRRQDPNCVFFKSTPEFDKELISQLEKQQQKVIKKLKICDATEYWRWHELKSILDSLDTTKIEQDQTLNGFCLNVRVENALDKLFLLKNRARDCSGLERLIIGAGGFVLIGSAAYITANWLITGKPLLGFSGHFDHMMLMGDAVAAAATLFLVASICVLFEKSDWLRSKILFSDEEQNNDFVDLVTGIISLCVTYRSEIINHSTLNNPELTDGQTLQSLMIPGQS
ncbi:MAG: hypothetical protein QM752_07415 [Gammaproteobacteria bacterium]